LTAVLLVGVASAERKYASGLQPHARDNAVSDVMSARNCCSPATVVAWWLWS